ncbi:UNVERIFIED_CONTAM: hypothetical protein GN151_00270 [Acinetobacter sp. HSTU-ASm16]|uniref:hypothetical protein n=1 Tax=Acinetobacter soli TaxID=487316 RepID=UPI0002CE4A4C|nr:hypothetical protein [Acinetobacter soli]ENV58002.1 hypothetical protein F951_01062 [Acinetobacter soli CIP 110264]
MSAYINRETSFTESEKLVNELGSKSFLRFWTWPNLFRDQENGKEICDLIIVFGNDILLISDKKIEFNTEKDPEIEWKRWYKKAITKSLSQTLGAERWIRKFPNRLFVDKGCTEAFPINFDISQAKFHHILVTHGLENVLEKTLGYASLQFTNDHKLSDHQPFKIGLINQGNPFFHVFTEKTLQDSLGHFDTANDFIEYLKLREFFFLTNKDVSLNAEGDLITLWYASYDKNIKKRNIFSNSEMNKDSVNLNYPTFDKFIDREDFKLRKELDKNSYVWDALIESFSFHILNGTSVDNTNWTEIHEIEEKIRNMAKANRFQRRILGDSFVGMYYDFKNKRGTRLSTISGLEQAYLFFCLPVAVEYGSMEQYREVRKMMLHEYAVIRKLKHPEIKSLVMIGFASARDGSILDTSFFEEGNDFGYIDFSDWSEEENNQAKYVLAEYEKYNLVGKNQITEMVAEEFTATYKKTRF